MGELTWKANWFRKLCGQGGTGEILKAEAARVADFGNTHIKPNGTVSALYFMSALDTNNGWPHGRAWAASPYAARAEAKYKILEKGL